MIDPIVTRVALRISAVLAGHRVLRVVAGGIAVAIHGYESTFLDVDLVVPAAAQKIVEQFGQAKPLAGRLAGVGMQVDGVEVRFIVSGHTLSENDLASVEYIAGLPVLAVEPLVLLKLANGHMRDMADIVGLVKLGKVPVKRVTERLQGRDREKFDLLVTIAELENSGNREAMKKANRALLAMLLAEYQAGD